MTSSVFPTLSVYNRDGTNQHIGRLWVDPASTSRAIDVHYLDSAGVYQQLASIADQENAGQHLYDPGDNNNDRLDRAGQWTYTKLAVDLDADEYLYAQVGDDWFDLSGISLRLNSSSGAKAKHFSFEFFQTSATRRYMHIGHFAGTIES